WVAPSGGLLNESPTRLNRLAGTSRRFSVRGTTPGMRPRSVISGREPAYQRTRTRVPADENPRTSEGRGRRPDTTLGRILTEHSGSTTLVSILVPLLGEQLRHRRGMCVTAYPDESRDTH